MNVDNIDRLTTVYILNVVMDPIHCKSYDGVCIHNLAGEVKCDVIPGKYHKSIVATTTFLNKYYNYNILPHAYNSLSPVFVLHQNLSVYIARIRLCRGLRL